MKSYTLEQLGCAETYTNDPELATFTRKICASTHVDGSMPFGDWKREYLAGQHAEHVFSALNEKLAIESAAKAEERRLTLFVERMPIPEGILINVRGDVVRVKTERFDNGDLNRRLNRLGGRWDEYEKMSAVPLANAERLPKIFSNWAKSQGVKMAERAAADVERTAAAEKARQERETDWITERQQEYEIRQAQQKAESARRAKAIAERQLIIVGEYKVGDLMDGKKITNLGKSWTESNLSRGTLYQPCEWSRCEGEPVCVNCFMCAKHCECCKQVTFCYAYFD